MANTQNNASYTAKSTFRTQMRHIVRQLRQYSGFFAALFLIEALFTVLALTGATDFLRTRQNVESAYDYDIAFLALSQQQYAALYNQCGEVPPENEIWRPYASVRYEKQNDDCYHAYITLRGSNPKDAAAYFLYCYLGDIQKAGDTYSLTYSPRYTYRADVLPGLWLFSVLCFLLLFAVSAFLLILLYRMRLDSDSYTFGIYMTCGATCKELCRGAVRELSCIGAVTLLPAALAGILLSCGLYASKGTAVAVSSIFPSLLFAAVCTYFVIVTSVALLMHRFSKKTPVSLLQTRDNSSFVVSPRRSFRLFYGMFPRKYECVSLWRYRKYAAWLLLSAVLLPILFLVTVSAADIREERKQANSPDFLLQFDAKAGYESEVFNEATASLKQTLTALDGVAYCRLQWMEKEATAINHHMLIRGENATAAGKVSVAFRGKIQNQAVQEKETYTRATNRYSYTALDRVAIEELYERYSDIEGNAEDIYCEGRNIVISESLNNTKRYSFHVGDTVLLSTSSMRTGSTDILSYDPEQILQLALNENTFGYEEFTVVAVIHDEAAGDALFVGVSESVYTQLCGEEPTRTGLEVYLDSSIDFEAYKRTHLNVYQAASLYRTCTVTDYGTYFSYQLQNSRNVEGRMRLLGWSFCCMSPLVCFFSQFVFYGKREKELEMLASLGASQSQLTSLCLWSGVYTALLTFFCSFAGSLTAEWILYKLYNEWLVAGSFITSVSLTFRIPIAALCVTLAVSLLCGILPPLCVEWRRRRNERNRTVGILAGD